ncbi:ABC transporter permease [Gordonia rhizosphera]|uniref:Putative ABC transporter permease protein n=1 Tax=Gordonia rhizosphera NBRC 16068 TaxID=1108045 RepID=K6VXD2_9ACTN|nr:ABC transporter permease [Gordonia rhizosphera]GAB91580.1 putative ABC transporter permease protein [Gordonia rhizosphera NBRC 16068]
MTGFVTAVSATFTREVARSRHRWVLTYLVPVFPPIVAVTLFADLMSPAENLPGFPASTYQDYVAASAVLLPGMMAAGLTASSAGADLRSGLADRLRVLGVSAAATTCGRLLFEGLRILPAAVAAYLAAVLLGDDVAWRADAMLVLLLLAVAWAIAYNGIFHAFAAITGSAHAPIALQPLFAPLTFLSIFWFPRTLMPAWGATVTDYNPISWLTDAGLATTIGGVAPAEVLAGVGTVLIVGAAGLVATVRILERRAAR